uniref:TFII-like transcription factor n=1 Tax=Borely moumouvirus TaxID=2712067 RepID=A0A6G6ACQ8_9VIRU
MTTVIEFYVSDKSRKDVLSNLREYFDKKICKIIEKGIYDYTKQYCKNDNNMNFSQSVYNDCYRNLIFNLKENCDTVKEIKEQIIEGNYNPYNLAFLKPDEFNKDNWIKIISRKKTTEEKLNDLPAVEWKPCRACKNTEYFYRQLQTRSADEPMTTFYTCKKCNKTYKVNN